MVLWKKRQISKGRFHKFPPSGGTESQSSFSLISLARLIITETTKHQPLKKLFHDAVRLLQLLPHHNYIESLLLRVYLSHLVHSIHLANFSGKLGNYNASAVCLLVVIQICKLAHFLTHVRFLCVRFSFCVSVSVLKMHLFIVFKRLLFKKNHGKRRPLRS